VGNNDPNGQQGSQGQGQGQQGMYQGQGGHGPGQDQGQNQNHNQNQSQGQGQEQLPVQTVQEKKKAQKVKTKRDIEKQLIREIKTRIDCYFSVNVNQMADLVPKIIGHYLVTSSLVIIGF
jgi:hypothetical protein